MPAPESGHEFAVAVRHDDETARVFDALTLALGFDPREGRRCLDAGRVHAMSHAPARAGERGIERTLQGAIAHDITQRRHALFFSFQADVTEAAALRDVDGANRRNGVRNRSHLAPDAEALEDETRPVREGERAVAAADLPFRARVERDDAELAVGEP